MRIIIFRERVIYMLASVFLSLIYLFFPLCCYFMYVVYTKVKDEREKMIFFDLALFSSYYLCSRFSNLPIAACFLINIPLLLSIYKKRVFPSVVLLFATSIFLWDVYNSNIYLFLIQYLISFVMLFIYGIKKSIFICVFLVVSILAGAFLYFYFNFEDNFINVFGTSFFYRIDRLLDWSNKSGMQLTNATAAIKAAGLFGFGVGNTPIYIPEAHTDFIFSIFASNFGLLGASFLIFCICLFDFGLIYLASKCNNKSHRYIIIGFITMILYQQIQNIGMNIGLLPITGITLPFISYGGSSLISYMIGIALVLAFINDN
jgi:cell division protein FtsW (lipid II flippase)